MGKRKGRPRGKDTEAVEFRGVTYTRRPGKRYFSTNRWDKVRKRYWTDFLHRAIWRFHHGEIPPGHDIHHKDDNRDNNDIGNLECLRKGEHIQRHGVFSRWNGTEEAKRHHERLWKQLWDRAPYREYICLHCGSAFQSRCMGAPPKYCSTRCGERYRSARLRSSGEGRS